MGQRDEGFASTAGSSGLRPKLARSGKAIAGSLIGGAFTILALIQKGAVLGAHPLLDLAHALLLALAIGWLGRIVIHGCVGYFRRTDKQGVGPWTLLAVSTLNACFCVGWLVVAIFLLLERSGTALTAAVVGAFCGICFLLSLCTHWAARKAGRPRASEWVRDHFREPLEPGKSTPVGWILVKLIDWRSAPHLLSTFVAGTVAALLLALLLTGSAAFSETSGEGPGVGSNVVAENSSRPRHPDHHAPARASVGPLIPPGLVSTQTSIERRGISLLCFPLSPVHRTPTKDGKSSTSSLFCMVISGGQVTRRAIIVTAQGKS
ncbi:MAG TPA: hypothetical protein VHI77_03565 [Solirubrobacterales bacterium]|jgi:hypothetical protein|nr:hypothetical protein [Solirubrobacterales bacterium]